MHSYISTLTSNTLRLILTNRKYTTTSVLLNNNNNNSLKSSNLKSSFIHKFQKRMCLSDHTHISQPSTSEEKQRIVLPKTLKPVDYNLSIQPDLDTFNFNGKVEINLDVVDNTNKIVFHSTDLKYNSCIIKSSNGDNITINGNEIDIDEKLETASINLPFLLTTNSKTTLIFDYNGILNDKMKGFYRSKYITNNGETRHMGVTQFEATDARRALPCWDEPSYKAIFNVSITVPEDRVAVSNMPVVSETVDKSMKTFKFAPSPIMSTYLLAWVVGEFDYVEGVTENGVKMRVYTLPGKKQQGSFALDVGIKSLDFYTKYFEIPYPLPKLDMLAIPDFAAGAMENWGCVTYREVALLVDEQNSSTTAKQYVALVVAHELAHQWFGNLTTMEWWNGLWLNEGFANFVEYLAVNSIFPQWNIWTEFVSANVMRALNLDSLKSSHPIEVEVYDPAEINEIFDAISYSKGSTVIRMIQAFLGDEVFRKAMVKYLTKFSYKNTVTEDLWAALDAESGKEVGKIMKNWTKETGYPVITVSRVGDKLKLEQARFFCNGLDNSDNSMWYVPLLIASAGAAPESILLEGKSMEITVPSSGFVKVNSGQTTPVRVLYSPELLAELEKAIYANTLSAVDRLGVQNDAIALAKAGLLSTVEVLKLFPAYSNEIDHTVWQDLATSLGELSSLLKHTDISGSFDAYAAPIFEKIGNQLGWEKKAGESDLNSILRGLVISQLVKYGNKKYIAEGAAKFISMVEGKTEVDPDIRASVYTAALKTSDAAFDQIIELYRAATLSEEKNRLLRALGTSPNPALLKRALDFAVSDEVRSQDAVFIIMVVAANKNGSNVAWNYIRDNWEMFITRYSGMFLIARLVQSVGVFNTHEMADEIDKFFSNKKVAGAERGILQVVEKTHSNADWLNREVNEIKEYLNNKKSNL